MAVLTFVTADGTETPVDVEPGANIMRTALAANIIGIVAECGGAAMCATCHVYVDEADQGALGPISAVEDEMLECTVAERRATSRLSCQLSMPDRDLTVHVPTDQI